MMGAGKSSLDALCTGERVWLSWKPTRLLLRTSECRFHKFFTHEENFKAETEALQTISRTKRAVIVTGGGIVLRKGNVEILKHLGLIVWLDGDEEALFARASRTIDRPLLKTKNPSEAFSQIFHARKPLYTPFRVSVCRYIAAYSRRSRHGDSGQPEAPNRKPGSTIPAATT